MSWIVPQPHFWKSCCCLCRNDDIATRLIEMRFVWRWRCSGSPVNWPARCRLPIPDRATILLLLLLSSHAGMDWRRDVKLLVAWQLVCPLWA